MNKIIIVKTALFKGLQALFLIWMNISFVLLQGQNTFVDKRVYIKTPDYTQFSSQISTISTSSDIRESKRIKVKKLSLEEKYKELAGIHYAENIRPYLPIIDKVLAKNGLGEDKKFIQAMFYAGQHESHWRVNAISSANIKGGRPTGIFQFLSGTFASVSSGDIFDARDQVRAFITMARNGRADEFGVFYICSYPPCLDVDVRNYVFYNL